MLQRDDLSPPAPTGLFKTGALLSGNFSLKVIDCALRRQENEIIIPSHGYVTRCRSG